MKNLKSKTGEITVVFKKGLPIETIISIIALLGLQFIGKPKKGVTKVLVPPGQENYWVDRFNTSDFVKQAEVSYVLDIHKKNRK